MNKERLLKLADVIEKAPHVIMDDVPALDYTASNIIGFDMSVYKSTGPCGTVGCIAGHAAALWPRKEKSIPDHIPVTAAESLGLSIDDAEELFLPYEEYAYLKAVTPLMAAQVLRLIAAGIPISDAWKQILQHEIRTY